jgi:hypothetical protein
MGIEARLSAPVTVAREDVGVMFMRAREDTPSSIPKAWAEFEAVVGLSGRKFFGAFDAQTREYRVCAQLREDDDPERLGLEVGTLPGGSYLRVRLQGEPPAIYNEIAPTMRRLAQQAAVDASRPSIEFYRSRDVIDLLVPIASAEE